MGAGLTRGAALLLAALAAGPQAPRLAEEQLALARRALTSARSGPEELRAAGIEEALAAYREVERRFPRDAAAVAEACFRRGELLRAGGREEAARGAFRGAVAQGPRTPFFGRARLELAHLHRRAERFERALDGYVALFADERAERSARDDAGAWAAAVYARTGRRREAERLLAVLARRAQRLPERVDAWGRLAELRAAAGAPEEARALLGRCRASIGDAARERTELGRALRAALARAEARVARAAAQRR